MAKGFVYLACAVDIYSRKSLSSTVSNTLDASFCVDATTEAVRLTGSLGIITTDQSTQLRSSVIAVPMVTSDEKLSVDGKLAWTDNIFIERPWRSLKVEAAYLRANTPVTDTKHWINQTIQRLKPRWPHASHGGKSPSEFHTSTPAGIVLMAS